MRPSRTWSTCRPSFTIESPTGQVSGTKRLATPVAGGGGLSLCDSDGNGLELDTAPLDLPYSATTTTPGGVFADRGRSVAKFTDQSVSVPTQFQEDFTSNLGAVEQEHSVLFGKRTPGTSWSAMSANTKRATPFVFYFTGNVRRIHAYIDGNGATSGSQVIRAVLYRHQPGVGPGAYVTRSFEFTVPAGMSARWVPFWLAPIPRLEPGVYWLGLQSGGDHGVARYAWDSSPNARRYNIDLFADGASDPFGVTFTDDQQMSLFAFGDYTN